MALLCGDVLVRGVAKRGSAAAHASCSSPPSLRRAAQMKAACDAFLIGRASDDAVDGRPDRVSSRLRGSIRRPAAATTHRPRIRRAYFRQRARFESRRFASEQMRPFAIPQSINAINELESGARVTITARDSDASATSPWETQRAAASGELASPALSDQLSS